MFNRYVSPAYTLSNEYSVFILDVEEIDSDMVWFLIGKGM